MTYDPNARQFYMMAEWCHRPDDAVSVATAYRQYMDGLMAIDPVLTGWQIGKDYTPFILVRNDMTAFLRRNVKRGDDGKPDPKEGFSIKGLSGDKRQNFSIIGRAACAYIFTFCNSISFRTNSNWAADTSIVTYALFKEVLLATIAAWRPEFCAAYSSALKPDASEGRYRKAWIMYVPPAFAESVDLVDVPFSEWTPDGGLLLSATDQVFDTDDPKHVAGAQRLHEATRHLNAKFDT